MRFIKYNSIENAYRDRAINQAMHTVSQSEPWYVSEKIHGANFGFYSNGIDVEIASRNGFVDIESFYSCGEVLDKYHLIAQLEAENIKAHYHDCAYVIFWGELYGPGIQSGVNYGPKKDFALFDICIVTDDDNTFILPKDAPLIETPTFKRVPYIQGPMTFDQALEIPNDGKSLVFPDAPGDNIMEGVVLTPKHTHFATSGKRIIIKNKNSKFSEKEHKKPRIPEPLSEELQNKVDILDQYISQQRFDNLFGKQPWGQRQFGTFLKEFNHDLFVDCIGDQPDLFDGIEKIDKKKVTRVISGRAAQFCKQYLGKI